MRNPRQHQPNQGVPGALEGRLDGVNGKVKASTGESNLDRKGGGGRDGTRRARRWGSEVGLKTLMKLAGSEHADDSAHNATDGNGAELTLLDRPARVRPSDVCLPARAQDVCRTN